MNSQASLRKLLLEGMQERRKSQAQGFSMPKTQAIFETELPRVMHDLSGLSKVTYKAHGSIGQGRMADVFWSNLCSEVFVSPETGRVTSRYGIYLVYLFSADGKRVYLSLNQGYTTIREICQNSDADARNVAASVAGQFRDKYKIPLTFTYLAEINLASQNPLPRGYEHCHIAGKEYHADQLPSDSILIKDLRELAQIYERIARDYEGIRLTNLYQEKYFEARGLVSIEESSEEDLTVASDDIDDAEEIKEFAIDYHPEKARPKRTSTTKSGYYRDPRLARQALERAHYKCEFDNNHITFETESGRPYVESHHLIPICHEGEFEYTLDSLANIVALCPNCHRRVHHGSTTSRREILETLFSGRQNDLKQTGIDLDIEGLMGLYRLIIPS